MGANLPEFKTCCGIFSLTSGVYALAVSGLILGGISIVFHSIIFANLLIRRDQIFKSESVLVVKLNITENGMETLRYWTSIGCGYYLAWICVKSVMVTTNFLLIVGVWKNKPKLIRSYLFINVPFWIIHAMNVLMSTYFFSAAYNVYGILLLAFDCYRLLVIRSSYRQIIGKIRSVEANSEGTNINYQRFNNSPDTGPRNLFESSQHCTTCTRPLNNDAATIQRIVIESNPQSPNFENSQSVPAVIPDTEEPAQQKIVNFKEAHIIFDQNQLQGCSSSVIEDTSNQRHANFTDSNYGERNETDEQSTTKEKKNIEDGPIIFDQNQFNVGTSPIFEDSPNLCQVDALSGKAKNIKYTQSIDVNQNFFVFPKSKNKSDHIRSVSKVDSEKEQHVPGNAISGASSTRVETRQLDNQNVFTQAQECSTSIIQDCKAVGSSNKYLAISGDNKNKDVISVEHNADKQLRPTSLTLNTHIGYKLNPKVTEDIYVLSNDRRYCLDRNLIEEDGCVNTI